MTEQCKYVSLVKDKGEWQCAITGRYCVGAVDAGGKIDSHHGYMAKAAQYCPAYNLEKDLAKSLQTANLDKQRSELEKKLE